MLQMPRINTSTIKKTKEESFKHITSHLSTQVRLFNLSQLKKKEILVLCYLFTKSSRSQVPFSVPLIMIARGCLISINQVRYVIKKLKKKNLLEVWTTRQYNTKGQWIAKTYFRIPLLFTHKTLDT